ncbi:MAG: hypothetical protein K2H09_07180 [Treponemataceae bacterium]|nr:hypothetical protein [Treponemataceae bacterium]
MTARRKCFFGTAAVLLIFVAALLGALAYNVVGFVRCFRAAELADAGMYQSMRIVVYGSSLSAEGETVSANLSILDTAGNECAVIERSWNGTSLAVDFVRAEFSGKWFFFPLAVRAAGGAASGRRLSHAASGSFLAHYYLEDGQCRLLGSGSSAAERKALFQLADFVLSPLSLAFRLGYASRCSVSLAQCGSGTYYGIFIGDGGWLELREQ